MSNWRDDARHQAEHTDYQERARVAGHREALPQFRHAAPVQTIRPPAEPQELPEEHDANTASRMSLAQLRDRIQGMEATTRMKASAEVAQGRRPEKPSERIARAAKLKAYRAEYARRTAAEQSAEVTAAQDRADLAQRDAERGAPARSAAAQVDPADVPALVQCNKCGLMVAQDSEGDMIGHLAIGQTICPAACDEWTRPRTNPNFAHRTAQPAPAELPRTCNAQGCSSQPADERGLCSFHRAHYDTAQRKSSEEQAEADAITAGAKLADSRLMVPCPECRAEIGTRCTNYKGQNCHPHGRRKAAPAQVATVAEIPPPPPAEAAAIATASRKRKATVEAAEKDTLSALDRAVEALVREHTSGAVIDAAWSASKRIFNPTGGRA